MASVTGGFAISADALRGIATQVSALANDEIGPAAANLRTTISQIEAAVAGATTTCQDTLASIWQGGRGSVAYEQVNSGLVTDGNNITQLLQQLQAAVTKYQNFFMTLSGDLNMAANLYQTADADSAAYFANLAGG